MHINFVDPSIKYPYIKNGYRVSEVVDQRRSIFFVDNFDDLKMQKMVAADAFDMGIEIVRQARFNTVTEAITYIYNSGALRLIEANSNLTLEIAQKYPILKNGIFMVYVEILPTDITFCNIGDCDKHEWDHT